MRIEKLRVEGFRGATKPVEINFEQKNVVLIFGENGTGKSTLIDALDFVCNERFGSLSERAGAQPNKHLPAVGCKREDLQVSVEAGGQTWKGVLGSGRAVIDGPEDRPSAMIMRRSQILRVVNAMPSERYKAIASYIELPGISRSENSLRDAKDAATKAYDESVAAKAQADEALQSLWRDEGEPGDGWWQWASQRAGADLATLQEEARVHAAALQKVERATDALQAYDDAAQKYRARQQEWEDAQGRWQRMAEQTGGDAALLHVLEEVQKYLKGAAEAEECPVCGASETAASLREKVVARLEQLQSLQQHRQALAQSARAKDDAAAVLQSALKALRNAVQPLAPDEDTTRTLESGDENAALHAARRLCEAADKDRVQLIERRDAANKALAQWTALANHVRIVREKTEEAKRLEALSNRLRALLTIVEDERKSYVNRMLETISTDVQRMYSLIHPGEKLGGVNFFLKSKFVGSLDFEGDFNDKTKVPPQAYYSESHLDTLGICVFLALAQHNPSGATVVVLDDVMTSVDAEHLSRFLDMIESEASRFGQLIVTTHYRKWLERYRAGSTRVQLVELGMWSLQHGVFAMEHQTLLQQLRDQTQPQQFDRQTAASKAGVMLEYVLDFLTLKYACKMPRQERLNYELGKLYGGVAGNNGKSPLFLALRVEDWAKMPDANGRMQLAQIKSTPLKPLIEAAFKQHQVRNQVGCHFNVNALEMSNAEVLQFASDVLALAEALVCPTCGKMPEAHGGGYWHCGKNHGRQLHPLTAPTA